MKRKTRHLQTKLAIIGAGLAGFAASIFALRRGIEVVQLGHTGAIAYTTGYFDLLGVDEGRVLEDPWAGLDTLRNRAPGHPLSRLGNKEIREAMEIFTAAISDMGLGYTKPAPHNLSALLPSGVSKPTLSVPLTMEPGIEAASSGARTLIIDFAGLQGFSAAEFKANFKARWPAIRTSRIRFPDMEQGQIFPEVMARSLEVPAMRKRLAGRIRKVLNGAGYVGLPAILGMHAPDKVHGDLQQLVGVPVFEIPTIPPAVPGIRLRELFERELPSRGLILEPQLKVKRADLRTDTASLYLSGEMEDIEVETSAVILATGRFLSGGLFAGRKEVRETLLGLPVSQPESRKDWYRPEYLDPRGHPVNRSGIEVDNDFRPLGPDQKPVNQRLFAAGGVLAHQDWVRQRCGAGLAIATAYRAVKAASEMLT